MINPSNRLLKPAHGTIFKLQNLNKPTETFIQTSKVETQPEWVKLGDFFEEVFDAQLSNREFIMNCLLQWEKKKTFIAKKI